MAMPPAMPIVHVHVMFMIESGAILFDNKICASSVVAASYNVLWF